ARRAVGAGRAPARHRARRPDRGGRERDERAGARRAAGGAPGGQRLPCRGHQPGQRERAHERRRPADRGGAQAVTLLANATEPYAHELWLVQIVKALLIFVLVLQIVPIILWGERKLLGRFQARVGPNRVGPYGLMQPIADVLKLLSKEQSTPTTAVPWMMALAPVISIFTAVASLAIIPFGPAGAWGGKFGLYGMDVSIGVLWPLAFGALAFYGLMLGGWASGSKYSFLGAMRSAAQLISYEVSLGLSLLGVIFTAGSLSLVQIVDAQAGMWYVVPQFVG